jgi:hypothetical protein
MTDDTKDTLLIVNVTLTIKKYDHPLDKIFRSIPALSHARFRACWIVGFHPGFSERL